MPKPLAPRADADGGPFGGNHFLTLLRFDLTDRLAGRSARASARWGFLTPPPGRGRVVWIAAGATRDSVVLGVGLARAIREKRLDVRVVLTFEAEYPDLLASLEGMARTGWGYAASDAPSAVRRVLARFAPLGVIFADCAPRPNLGRALGSLAHVASVGDAPRFDCEYAVPAAISPAADIPHADPADLLALLVEPQPEPVLRALVSGTEERTIWWLHDGAGSFDAGLFARDFRAAHPDGVLFVSGADWRDGVPGAIAASGWDRTPLPSGSIVVIDDARWIPATAAAARGAHLERPQRHVFWQALACGTPSTCAGLSAALPADVLRVADGSSAIFAQWREFCGDVAALRPYADALRRRFWDERRRASAAAEALMQRVFDWD